MEKMGEPEWRRVDTDDGIIEGKSNFEAILNLQAALETFKKALGKPLESRSSATDFSYIEFLREAFLLAKQTHPEIEINGCHQRRRFFNKPEFKLHRVDIGYHHTSSKKLDSIKKNGLLLRSERQQQNITHQLNRGIHGDGIYCANDPILNANQRYGDMTIMLLRIKGIEADHTRLTHDDTHYDTLNLPSKGCSVLRSRNQSIPLFQFPSRLLGKQDGFDQLLAEFHQKVQDLVDKHFNKGVRHKFREEEFPRRILPPPSFHRVWLPEGVQPGEKFQAYAGNKIVTVRCPMNCKPGEYVPFYNRTYDTFSPITGQVTRIADTEPPAYVVTIPAGISPGMKFPVSIEGQMLLVTCPMEAGPGKFIKIVPPKPDVTPSQSPSLDGSKPGKHVPYYIGTNQYMPCRPEDIRDEDYICGQSSEYRDRLGNKIYREVIESWAWKYKKALRKKKSGIVKESLKDFQNRGGGRFLEKNEEDENYTVHSYDGPGHFLHDKVASSFRDASKKKRSHSAEENVDRALPSSTTHDRNQSLLPMRPSGDYCQAEVVSLGDDADLVRIFVSFFDGDMACDVPLPDGVALASPLCDEEVDMTDDILVQEAHPSQEIQPQRQRRKRQRQ